MATEPPPTATPAGEGWHRFTTAEPAATTGGPVAVYGADLPSEAELRLLGNVDGKRVLDLGCGSGHNAVVFAQQGAKVIAVDPSAERLAMARDRAEDAGVRIELHQAGLADLAFLRSDSVDAAVSVLALATVDDLARVFRQVHRVLKPEAPLVCSFPHPAFAMLDPTAPDPLRIARPYDHAEPSRWALGAEDVVDHPRTIGEVFTTLHRSSFGVDQLLEPTAPAAGHRSAHFADVMRAVPATVVFRARKQGN
ncbi:MAG TPA: class I SAM-dependent methyltransferase [Aquihabitans sp.]|nr:class I SAM-dependent methyltransferase [Aquihabitans sp.]